MFQKVVPKSLKMSKSPFLLLLELGTLSINACKSGPIRNKENKHLQIWTNQEEAFPAAPFSDWQQTQQRSNLHYPHPLQKYAARTVLKMVQKCPEKKPIFAIQLFE